ncbi:hypothetical protein A6R68_15301, partial [Neotoma lepida]
MKKMAVTAVVIQAKAAHAAQTKAENKQKQERGRKLLRVAGVSLGTEPPILVKLETMAKMEVKSSLLDNMIGVGDMVLLEPLNEETFIDNLKKRFDHSEIYTYIGSVVISVNPYRSLPIYSPEKVEDYRNRNFYELSPHIALASSCHGNVPCACPTALPHCDVALAFAVTYEKSHSSLLCRMKRIDPSVIKIKTSAYSLLEKVEQEKQSAIHDLYVTYVIACIYDHNCYRYLLTPGQIYEELKTKASKLVMSYVAAVCGKGAEVNEVKEQLLQSNPVLEDKLKLERDFSRYNYLSLDSAKVNGVDDAANFRTVRNAMQIVGFMDHEAEAVLEVVAAVLKLGNIEFKPESRVNGLDESKIKDKNGSFWLDVKSRTQAYYARDALAKNLYSRLFSWLVNRINESIKDNSFEQFIINYCNEKLQQIFIELTLKEEQEEYIREDIEWTHIDYFNNAIICDLIENIRYLGLLENVRVRRAGYAFRQAYEPCLERYKMLCKQTWPHWKGPARSGVEVLFNELEIPMEEYSFGRSKIFIRNPRTLFQLEDLRKQRLEDLATLIQKIYRGWKCRTHFLLMKKSQIVIAAWCRRYAQQKRYQQIKSSALVIQSYIRGWKARKLLRELKHQKRCKEAATTIAAYWHGTQARRELSRLKEEARNKHAIAVIWAYWLGSKVLDAPISSLRPGIPHVGQPFQGAYLEINKNPKYKKLKDAIEEKIIIAEVVNKINRANGK